MVQVLRVAYIFNSGQTHLSYRDHYSASKAQFSHYNSGAFLGT